MNGTGRPLSLEEEFLEELSLIRRALERMADALEGPPDLEGRAYIVTHPRREVVDEPKGDR